MEEDLLKGRSPPSTTRNPDSPLFLSSNYAFPGDYVDTELRIAEAKERMKQTVHESQDICRKLNFDSEDAHVSLEEIGVNLDLTFKKITTGCSREQRQEDHNLSMISFDGLIGEKVGDDMKSGSIKISGDQEGLLYAVGGKEMEETIGENKRQWITDQGHEDDDFEQQSTDFE